ncbi:acyltransferase family protein [Armatimonas sp.]|uniref:acyltransferase family protein n=1 Tax=Armatimonas sp. TaxID=1872638 RepID=UPI003750256A
MRNLGLDLMRIVAVFLVLGRHLYLSESSSHFLGIWQRGGWVGVDIFFVLSGFLVSGLLFKEHQRTGSLNIKRFLIRRALKIYPSFWVMILCTLCVSVFLHQPLSKSVVLSELLFIQNYVFGLWWHTWSLAVEEHFYLLLSVLMYVLTLKFKKSPFSRIPLFFIVIAVTCFLLRVVTSIVIPTYSPREYLFGSHLRFDSLFYGVFLSYMYNYKDLLGRFSKIPSLVLLLSGVLLLIPAFKFPLELYKWVSVYGVILFYIGSGLLLIAAIRLKESNNPLLKFLGALGGASYSIYLWHMPVNEWGEIILRRMGVAENFGVYLCMYLIGSCLVGYVFNKLIEWPVLHLRDKLFPSLSK